MRRPARPAVHACITVLGAIGLIACREPVSWSAVAPSPGAATYEGAAESPLDIRPHSRLDERQLRLVGSRLEHLLTGASWCSPRWPRDRRGCNRRGSACLSHPLRRVLGMTLQPVELPPESGLNPAQAEAERLLREPRDQRPIHRRDLRDELRGLLTDGLAEVCAWVEKPIFLSKHTLSSVHGCEARFLHELEQPFTANAATVKGAIAHKAIELSVASAGHSPGKLVDRAMARLREQEDWVGLWLAAADELDRAEVRTMAGDRVAKFIECFPPLRTGWRPVTESRWAAEFHDKVKLSGKVDLTIGGPDGLQAGKVVIDFKTGGRALSHIEDLRFYGLLETLRVGVPPWKVATYYLDSGTFAVEVVSEGMLEAAARRVIAGAEKLAELREGGREPVLQPGPTCSWCPRFTSCTEGQLARARWEEFG